MARPILAALTLALCVGLAPLAGAQSQKWDQATVTDLSDQLEKSITGLRDTVRGSAQFQVPSNRRYLYEIMDNLRQLEFLSGSLHKRLQSGEGLESTTPTYNKLQQIRRDTQVIAEKVDISAITRPKLEEAQGILAKLAPYYPAQPGIQDVR